LYKVFTDVALEVEFSKYGILILFVISEVDGETSFTWFSGSSVSYFISVYINAIHRA